MGNLIFMSGNPLIVATETKDGDQDRGFCDGCGEEKPCQELSKCKGCESARYCGKVCVPIFMPDINAFKCTV